jgi:collagen type VII alpha
MAIYIDDLGGSELPIELNNPQDGESLVWSEEQGAYVNAPAVVTTENVQDIVADMVEVDSVGSQLSLRLVSNYDDETGKLTFNVVTDGGGSGGSLGGIAIKENGATRGTVSAIDFIGSNVSIANGTASITGLLNSLPIYASGVDVGNARSFNFEGLNVIMNGDRATIVGPDLSSIGNGGGSYVLPTASTTVKGGVKVDGTTIVADSNGVISAVGGGSGGISLNDVGTYLSANGYATQTYVQGQVSNLINGAPGALNTLQELASALSNDPSFATTITTGLSGKLSLTGGTMTGALVLAGNPVNGLDAVPKQYVDARISQAISSVPNTSLLDDLIDVDTSGVQTGQLLGWDGDQWIPVNNSGTKGDTGATGPQGPAGLSISSATVSLQGKLLITLSNSQVVDAGNVAGLSSAVVNSSGELILTKQDGTTINAGSTVGPQGVKGDTGATGPAGPTGAQGPAGLAVTGAAVNGSGRLIITRSDSSIIDAGLVIGPKGDTGATGSKGDTGDTGAAGVGVSSATVNGSGRLIITKTDSTTVDAGSVIGPKGDQGATGATGATGAKGDQGVSVYQAVVDGDGNLQVTLDDATTINAGSVIGPMGPQGVQGPAGRSIASSGVVVDESGYLQITLTDGTTVNAGYVVGPQGSTGATGAKGDKGDTGATGAKGDTGDTGASYTINGKSGSVQVYGLGNTTQPGYDLEVDLSNKANKWTTARTLTLSGKVTGLTSFDGSGNITMTTALNAVTTSDISEGTNKYYTDARARLALSSVSDGNITSLISYDDTTGQIKYRANTSYITEGSNLYFTNARADARADSRIAAASINALADVDTVTTAPTNGQVLTWTGSAWTPSSVSGGSGAVSSVNGKTGAVSLSSDDVTEGTTNLYYTTTRWDNRLASKTTDNLNEGTTNKYFSNTLARNALTAGTGLSYNSSTGSFSLNASTTNVTEGSNLYYTSTRFDTRLGQSNLSQLADVADTTPTSGQALAWNGSAWAPTTISGGSGGGGSSSGIFRSAVQVEYDASGNLSSVNVLSGGISAVIATATSTTATVTFTFTGSVCAPLNIQVYGYQRASNVYVTRSIGSDYTSRTLAGGGSSGSPSAFSAFDPSTNTMTLSLTKALTGATAAVGQTTHCVLQFLLSDV